MSKIARFAVLVAALMSLFAVMSSAAGAVTWENAGNTSFTATAGAHTLAGTGIVLACAGATATGTAPDTPFMPTGSNRWSVATMTVTYSCPLLGSPGSQECAWNLTVPGSP